MTDRPTGDHIQVGDIRQAQGIAIGRGARAEVHGNVISGAEAQVDPEALRSVLRELRTALGQAGLPDDVQLRAETAAGNALVQGIKDGKAQPEPLVAHVEQIGKSLKEAHVAVEEGSKLWESVQKLAPVLGPLVAGGARAVAAWFGVPLSI